MNNKFQQKLFNMQMPKKNKKYITFTLIATEDNKIQYSTQTNFYGYTKKIPRRELRISSEVDPIKMANLWKDLKEPCVFVNTEEDFKIFLLIGGHAIIAKDIVRKKLPFLLEPREVATDGFFGTIDLDLVNPNELQKAPTPKKRMEILKRDNYSCKICGRRPANCVDIELHIHHITPWAKGGLTKPNNLLTLCHTCHNGLDPHHDWNLYNFIPNNVLFPSFNEEKNIYLRSVLRYRELIWRILRKPEFK
jgi:hypothetical protein